MNKAPLTKYLPGFVLLFVSFGVYFNALFGDFVYDDKYQIVHNPWIRDFSNVPAIFSGSAWNFLRSETNISNYYRPLMHLVYMLNYHLFGLNPWGFHLINILFHCGDSVLVFLLMRRILHEQGDSVSASYLLSPFIAATLFAVHPIHTEAVAWISALPDVAFTFFYLLSFYLYVRSRTITSASYLFSVMFFAIAAFFKEPALTLPVILFAHDYLFGQEQTSFSDFIRRYAPYLLISLGYLALRIHALGEFAPMKSYATLSAYEYIINVFPLFTQYLAKLIVPVDLNALYVFHPIFSLAGWKGILSLMATVLFVALFLSLKKNRAAFLGFLLMTVPLLPALYVPALGASPFAERYLYLPSVGYALLLATFLSWINGKLPRAARGITIAFIVIAGLFAIGTINRNNVWKNSFNLWSDTVRKSPDSPSAHNDLGIAYVSQGRVDKAVAEYETALQLKPEYTSAHNNLGTAYASQGRLDRAIPEFEAVLRLKPDEADAHFNLGVAYASQGRLDRAAAEYQEVLRLNPGDYEARQRLNDVISRQH